MRMRSETRRRLRLWAALIVVGAICGPPLNYFVYERTLGSILRGLIDGAIIAALVAGYAQFARDLFLREWFRRFNFSATVLVNACAYLILFHIGRLIGVGIHDPQEISAGLSRFLVNPQINVVTVLFFFIAIVVEFLLQMNRLVGHNVLWYFLAGTYHRPKKESRIFMFLDLRDSTTMAENMGGETYYALLELFVNALTEPVLATGGEIHEYVGDEVVITWKQSKGLRNGNCVRCFFLIEEALAELAGQFRDRFNTVPRFCAGLHGGQVVAGELGDIKRDIVFVGDIVNTAARLEEFAKKHAMPLVASSAIVDAIELPDGIVAEYAGDHQPRGKAATVKLYDVHRLDAETTGSESGVRESSA